MELKEGTGQRSGGSYTVTNSSTLFFLYTLSTVKAVAVLLSHPGAGWGFPSASSGRLKGFLGVWGAGVWQVSEGMAWHFGGGRLSRQGFRFPPASGVFSLLQLGWLVWGFYIF